MTGRPGAFLDRDGTIVRDANYIRDPEDVVLLSGAAEAIGRLNRGGIPVVVVTNQSGIARGWLTDEDYEAVRRRLDELLEASGAKIDATFMCPHYPSITGPCECRKPGLKLYREAIAALNIDPTRSLFVGDRWRDVAPAAALGGRPIFLDVESSPREDRERVRSERIPVAHSLAEAVETFVVSLPAPAGQQ